MTKKTKQKDFEQLPEEWQKLSLEEKYDIVDEKFRKLADFDCDYCVKINLHSYLGNEGRYICIEQLGENEWDDDGGEIYKLCQFVRKKPVAPGEVQLKDFSKELQEELRDEDWSGEFDSDMPNIINSRVEGKDWSECLQKIFQRLELLRSGYEICWECEEYREEHREFFKEHFSDEEEDDEEDED